MTYLLNRIILKKDLKLNILDLIGLISEKTIVGLSNLISVGKHAFTKDH